MFILLIYCPFDGAKVWLFWEEGKYLADFCLMLWRQEQNQRQNGRIGAELCRKARGRSNRGGP